MSCRRWPVRWRASVVFLSFCLETKGPKVQGRLHRASPRLSKRLTLRSRSAFCEGKRQAPLREGQPFSHPLRALPRPAALPPRPTRSVFGVPTHGTRKGNCTNGQRSRSLPSSRAFPLSKGVPEGRGIKVPRSPIPLGASPAAPRQRPRGPSTAARGS